MEKALSNVVIVFSIVKHCLHVWVQDQDMKSSLKTLGTEEAVSVSSELTTTQAYFTTAALSNATSSTINQVGQSSQTSVL